MFFIRHAESEFNAAFSGTGRDPGVIDAPLTPRGEDQARHAGRLLKPRGITRILCSPYARALQTACLIADELGVAQLCVTPLLGERALYSCDVGTCKTELAAAWAAHDFSNLEHETWWPKSGETQDSLARRVTAFMALEGTSAHAPATLAVSHWYFIFTLSGLDLDNAQTAWRDEAGRFHKQ